MSKELLIVFAKNIKLGKVKTRLAKTIGDQGAFEVYKELFKITETVTDNVSVQKRIYFSDVVIDSKFKGSFKTVQVGNDLGEKMKNAFRDGYSDGFENIILIGSDLPEISEHIISTAFEKLKTHDTVFGPAEDGGYYLIGLSKMNHRVFDNKPWSQSTLLNITLQELSKAGTSVSLLEPLNDIDTYEDLIHSTFFKENASIQQIVMQHTTLTNS